MGRNLIIKIEPMNKQTVYKLTDASEWTCKWFLKNDDGGPYRFLNELESVYVFTKEELEAMKAEWQRESALALYAFIAGYSSLGKPKIPDENAINDFLDRELPIAPTT